MEREIKKELAYGQENIKKWGKNIDHETRN